MSAGQLALGDTPGIYPTEVMKATRLLNGQLARWVIYAEPRGVPYSYVINTRGGRVAGSARTLDAARQAIDGYYQHMTLPSELWDVTTDD